jgi:hypothetical protein
MSASKKRADGWWIVGVPEVEDCGPYPTKTEAEEDRQGLGRFRKYENEPGYVTCETVTLGDL